MRRAPNPWPIGLREPNPAGVRETRAVAVMVGHSEEVGSGYGNAGGERYLVISVALVVVRACFRVRRRSTRTSTDGPPRSSVNPSRLLKNYPPPCNESALITLRLRRKRLQQSRAPWRSECPGVDASCGRGRLPVAPVSSLPRLVPGGRSRLDRKSVV